jgi:hypothetical protein
MLGPKRELRLGEPCEGLIRTSFFGRPYRLSMLGRQVVSAM